MNFSKFGKELGNKTKRFMKKRKDLGLISQNKTRGQILWQKVRQKFNCSPEMAYIMSDPVEKRKLMAKILKKERKKKSNSNMYQINQNIRMKTKLTQEKITENTKLFNDGSVSLSCGPLA